MKKRKGEIKNWRVTRKADVDTLLERHDGECFAYIRPVDVFVRPRQRTIINNQPVVWAVVCNRSTWHGKANNITRAKTAVERAIQSIRRGVRK